MPHFLTYSRELNMHRKRFGGFDSNGLHVDAFVAKIAQYRFDFGGRGQFEIEFEMDDLDTSRSALCGSAARGVPR